MHILQNVRQRTVLIKQNPQTGESEKCHLCASESLTGYSKPSSWAEETRQWVNDLCSLPIPAKAIVYVMHVKNNIKERTT